MAITATVSGRTYRAAMECSEVPDEIGLPSPTFIKRGRGYRAVYSGISREVAIELLDHLDCLAECSGGWEDGAGEGAAIRKDAATLRTALGLIN